MKKMQSLAAVAACLVSGMASASLIFDNTIILSAQGFGNAPRDLTIQATGNASTESGCVGVSASGQIIVGPGQQDPLHPACTLSGNVFLPNTVQNLGGNEPNPLADNQKYGIPTLGSLGITSANQIGILFNGTEPAGNQANVIDITLNFYTSTGTLLGAIDGSFDFLNTLQGNGSAGFVFIVDNAQQAYVNSLILLGGSNTILSLNASLTNVSGGPDSFLIANLNAPPPCPNPNPTICVPQQVPEPGSLALLGLGALGLYAVRRKQRNS